MNILHTLSYECMKEKLKKKETRPPTKIKWKTPLCQEYIVDASKNQTRYIFFSHSPRSILSNSSSNLG